MSQKNFAVAPAVHIQRSKFKRPYQVKTSFNLGKLIPIGTPIEVLPGDTHSIDMASLVRMSTPVAPIMDNIYVDYYAFFVPNRLVWSHWKEFMGENTTSAGVYSGTEYVIPTLGFVPDEIDSDSIGAYFGLRGCTSGDEHVYVSALPIRGYTLIYNEWFRDQNLIAPVVLNTGDSTASEVIKYEDDCFDVAKVHDYFTSCLPYAQKGSASGIALPEIGPSLDSTGNTNPLQFKPQGVLPSAEIDPDTFFVREDDGFVTASNTTSSSLIDDDVAYYSGLKLKGATDNLLFTINQLRFATQVQRLLENDLSGTRYVELLKAHFNVDAPDASLQRPEFLGHYRQDINIDQVIQTTGINQSSPASNTLGQTAAISRSAGKSSLFTKSFTEHGYIFLLACARHDQTYSQGVNRMWSRKHRYDFYFPEFANLGNQPVYNKEICAGLSTDDEVFGYQEAWAEYKFMPSICTGLLNPAQSGSLGFWTLTNNFASCPTLGKTFIEQDRTNLARCLSTGSNGPDFIADFYINDIAVRPMPMYSIPGLMDHH